MGRGRVTVADVAREAGVSTATVSFVLNDTPNQKIPEQTRQRVHDAVAKLGYTRSAAARALSRGRSDTVLLVLPDVPIGPLLAQMIEALTEDLGGAGLSLLTRRELPHSTLAALWRELAPAAVITVGDVDPAEHRAMRAAGIYHAAWLPGPASRRDAALVVPNERIGHLQATHLAATGHRRIGYAAPTDARLTHILELRLSGVRAACLERGLDEPVIQPVALDVNSAASAAAAWRAAQPAVTAVCAYNDEVAFALLAGMRKLGLTTPDDLAVIGVDNIPTAPFANPPLTTVDQNLAAMSAHLSSMVTHGIGGKRPPRRPGSDIITLIVRDSA
jgi:DNA-binding LacI/PurR family transcriptional regulator